MFTDNRRYISEIDTRDDYINLDLKLQSSNYIWNNAIDIFRGRIEGRYLEPINTLITTNVNKNGFAAMALCCLLIDTLMQFREGFPQSKNYGNKKYYTKFLYQQMDSVFDEQSAISFYIDIRCGILHSAQTKNGSCLTFGTDYIVNLLGNGVLMVDIPNMYRELLFYFESYCDELRNPNNIDIRTNFICKMDDITKKLDGSSLIDDLWFAICEKEGREIHVYKSNYVIASVSDRNIKLQNSIFRSNRNIWITKEEIGDALYYWPNINAIKMLDKGEYLYTIIDLCRGIADEVIIHQTA